jgi:hypothetical protein
VWDSPQLGWKSDSMGSDVTTNWSDCLLALEGVTEGPREAAHFSNGRSKPLTQQSHAANSYQADLNVTGCN